MAPDAVNEETWPEHTVGEIMDTVGEGNTVTDAWATERQLELELETV